MHEEFRALGLEESISRVLASRQASLDRLGRRERARRYWLNYGGRGVGSLIVHELPITERGQWAARCLKFALQFAPSTIPVAERLIEMAVRKSDAVAVEALLADLFEEAKASREERFEGFRWMLVDAGCLIAEAAGSRQTSRYGAGIAVPQELHSMAARLGDSVLAEGCSVLTTGWIPSDEVEHAGSP